jgi:uncharacterized protein YcaQ
MSALNRDKFSIMISKIDKSLAKDIWIHSQRLDQEKAFGEGVSAVAKAVSHLGYVQIDTISVIERCHHHILYNRIPNYHPRHLQMAQSKEKSVFEYWTHALSYVPTKDYKYFVREMKNVNTKSGSWFSTVTENDYKKVRSLLKKHGAISIRDIKDDLLVEKTHPWGSAKPSKKALQLGFYKGDFVVAERAGMLKKYDLTERHFGWKSKPRPASESDCANYSLERALKSQGIVSLDSVCYLRNSMKKSVSRLIDKKIKSRDLIEIEIDQIEKVKFYAKPEILDGEIGTSELTHILSPFDPLIIQRKRLKMFFDYEHLFEAYIPKEKRKFGYFTLPVLHQNEIIALLDLKTDRTQKKLHIQSWTWHGKNKSHANMKRIENELERFEKFQIESSCDPVIGR